jgi:DNA-binding SARP family transcriptional activator
LTRDRALDLLWPEADGDAAVNNLNQTVFQLRRYLDPSYRQGESPEYVISTSEHLKLATDLIRSDVDEIRRLLGQAANATFVRRSESAAKALTLVRGEFLADLRYEPWASQLQLSVHNDLRSRLLPMARAGGSYDIDIATSAATALTALDPFDDEATIALAECLTRSGRRIAARDLLVRYADQVRSELDDEPSTRLIAATQRIRGANQT